MDLSGFIDGYYSGNFNQPTANALGDQLNQLYNFNDKTDQFELSAAKLTLNHDPDPVGAHVDFIYGRTNTLINNASDQQYLRRSAQLHRAGFPEHQAAQGQGI
jgi:hypothetical protein